MGTDYWSGFVAGAVVCAVVGIFILWLWKFYQAWVRAWQALNKPQVVVHTTGQTPMQVYRAAMLARARMTCLQTVVILCLLGLLVIWQPGIGGWVLDAIAGIFSLLLG